MDSFIFYPNVFLYKWGFSSLHNTLDFKIVTFLSHYLFSYSIFFYFHKSCLNSLRVKNPLCVFWCTSVVLFFIFTQHGVFLVYYLIRIVVWFLCLIFQKIVWLLILAYRNTFWFLSSIYENLYLVIEFSRWKNLFWFLCSTWIWFETITSKLLSNFHQCEELIDLETTFSFDLKICAPSLSNQLPHGANR